MPDENTLQPVPEDWQRALAIAAHPDDLEYGAASAIARWTSQGKWVGYLLVTRGEAGIDSMRPDETGPLRTQEEIAGAAVVGVDTVDFLEYADGMVEYGLPLRRDIARAIRQHKPEILITGSFHLKWPSGALNMADHRAVGIAVLDAARDAGNRWIFPELLDEGFEPWNGVRFVCVAGSPEAAHGVDVTDHIDTGVASLKEHEAYINGLGRDFDPNSFLKDNASWAGAEMGAEYAVRFEIINV
ncbi:MAG: PIG-L family deacetylase [Chloroflexi bacterium]|nr:PIG-L family deacetylase [Chloroflexota bacterium]